MKEQTKTILDKNGNEKRILEVQETSKEELILIRKSEDFQASVLGLTLVVIVWLITRIWY